MTYLIGLDIGTTNAKAIAVSSDGRLLAAESASYPAVSPQTGYAEQDTDVVVAACLKVLKKAVLCEGQLAGIAFSAAMHGVLPVDESGQPLSRCIIWADNRSSGYASQLKHSTVGASIYRRTGTPLHSMSPLCKIAWLRDHDPEVFQRAHKFVSIKEYLVFRLTGEWAVDYSLASATGLFDNAGLHWHPEALDFAGLRPESLSTPVSPYHVFRTWLPGMAEKLDIEPGTPLIIGASDGCLANLGELATEPGDAVITIGTSAALRVTQNKALVDKKGRIFNYLLTAGWYVAGGASNNGGSAWQWLCDDFMKTPLEEAARLAQSVNPGTDGLLFLPWLLGERAPIWNEAARGVFLGISGHHQQAHFCRAVLEGVVFNLFQIGKIVEESGAGIQRIYANGGFTKMPVWVQIVADVFGVEVVVRDNGDSSAFGAVLLGMKALGILTGFDAVRHFFKAKKIYTPDAERHEAYQACLLCYEKAAACLSPLF
ncbi:MAG: gluconokinase [Saprospiraceae bacterium]